MRTRSPLDPLRNRMTLAGLATIAGAALAGGGIDRALALAESPAPCASRRPPRSWSPC